MGKKAIVKGLMMGIIFVFLVTFVYGQDYPSKPVEFLVGLPPGGASDTTSRVLCNAAEKALGQPLVVVNKPGVGGALALSYLANQKPDGYTISYTPAAPLIVVPFIEKVTYKVDDFSYLMGFGYMTYGLTVKADAPWNSFREFLDHAKKNPGKVKFASFSPVSTTSIVMSFIAKEEKVDWTHIPYKGDGPAITALLGGHVDALAGASGQMPYVRSGLLKLLCILTSYANKEFPKVPTVKSLGYEFPNLCDMASYQGVIAPKGIKLVTAKKLEDLFIKAARDSAFVKTMDSLSCPIVYKNGKEFEMEILNSYRICETILPPIMDKINK